jgi:5-methylthioadenosine/S-adenosylhomocysteine deaminase
VQERVRVSTPTVSVVGLGIDDHYWHDSYDMFGEARQARSAANLERTTGQFSSMELVRMLTIEGARALGLGDEVGSLEAGKRADLLLVDLETPNFVPRTNLPAQVANNAAPADVSTVLVDGDVVVHDGTGETMDVRGVEERVEAAVERFADETGWELGAGGSEPPGPAALARDLPKRGPARLLGRLALQSVADTVPFPLGRWMGTYTWSVTRKAATHVTQSPRSPSSPSPPSPSPATVDSTRVQLPSTRRWSRQL